MKKTVRNLFRSALALGAVFGLTTGAQAAESVVPQFVTTNTTWVAATTYILNSQISYITSGATLTVEPGTVVIGRGVTAGSPGTLVVSRGAQIIANGTAANPIVFTSDSDLNVPGVAGTDTLVNVDDRSSQWGGLVLLGRTHVSRNTAATGALDDDGSTSNIIEGISNDGLPDGGGFEARAAYGGRTGALARDDDNSGSLQYVSIRFGGVGLASNAEVNGLTLGAVGRSTKIENIEIVNNLDDGIEFFGGTVNTKYIAMYGIGDDGFDWDEGFRGKAQFIFNAQTRNRDSGANSGSGIPDKGAEMDGANSNDANWPYSVPTLYNVTFVGMGKNYPVSASPDASLQRNSALHFRDNTGGRYRNSLFLDFYYGLIVEDERNADLTGVASPNAADADSAARLAANYNPTIFGSSALLVDNDISGSKELELRECTWWSPDSSVTNAGVHSANTIAGKFSPKVGSVTSNLLATNDFTAITDATTLAAASPKSVSGYGDSAFSAYVTNTKLNGPSNTPIVSLVRRQYLGTSTVDGPTTYQISQIDPRAANTATTSSITPPADGFFSPVAYKGAFSPSKNWLAGWSWMDQAGLFPTISNPSNPTASAPAFLFSFDFATVNGVVYEVGASTNPAGPFSPIGSVVGDGSTVTYVDTRTVTTRQFYSVTAQ